MLHKIKISVTVLKTFVGQIIHFCFFSYDLFLFVFNCFNFLSRGNFQICQKGICKTQVSSNIEVGLAHFAHLAERAPAHMSTDTFRQCHGMCKELPRFGGRLPSQAWFTTSSASVLITDTHGLTQIHTLSHTHKASGRKVRCHKKSLLSMKSLHQMCILTSLDSPSLTASLP